MEVEEEDQEDVRLDSVGAKYLKVVNSVSFLDVAVFTVELLYLNTGDLKLRKQRILR